MWVMVFFMLSGFVLPLKIFIYGEKLDLTRRMVKRYVKLMVPILIAISLIYLMCLNLRDEEVIKDYY
jgi:peptidoglycan/LPS O-acetylase OafA/YrhL